MELQLGGTEMDLWVGLLKKGQERAHVTLSETEESYTAIMLQRFTKRSDLTSITLALGFLEYGYGTLWEAADAGLLVAGLFPERAKKKNVSVSYLTGMSQTCFFELANVCEKMKHRDDAKTYRHVGAGVERVACVLYCARMNNRTMQEIFAEHGINLH